MKILFDYFPIICFFVGYKLWGIYIATAITMGASLLQNGLYWLKNKRFEKMHVITLVSVLVLGGFTLIFHKAIYIKWKPSIIYFAFAIALIISQYFSKKNLLHRLLGDKVKLSKKIWEHLTIMWALFFIFLGLLNIYVLYHFSTNAWVNFKLFGTLGLTLIFTILQAVYMSKHIEEEPTDKTTIIKG